MDRSDLNILAVFLAVAEERSFTRAGKRLGVSPSAMSHAIRGLEEDIGVRLLFLNPRVFSTLELGVSSSLPGQAFPTDPTISASVLIPSGSLQLA